MSQNRETPDEKTLEQSVGVPPSTHRTEEHFWESIDSYRKLYALIYFGTPSVDAKQIEHHHKINKEASERNRGIKKMLCGLTNEEQKTLEKQGSEAPPASSKDSAYQATYERSQAYWKRIFPE